MIDEITKTLTRLKLVYPVSITSSENEWLKFSVDGIQDTFYVDVSLGDCMIGTEEWHEHLEDAIELNNFLHSLFSGSVQIKVKYRGKHPVGHSILTKDGQTMVTTSGSCIAPFWKKKSYKMLDYTLPKTR